MRKILRIDDTRRAKVDTDRDVFLWDSRAGRTGRDSTRWTRLYVHECKGGDNVFYLAHFTQWQGERNVIEQVSLEQARTLVEDHYDDLADGIDDETLAAWLAAWGLLDLDALE
jgi:hypothetical protein